MENWFYYIVLGLILGGIIIFIWEELDRSNALLNESDLISTSKLQREQILSELKMLLPHNEIIKQQAIEQIYKFAASKNQFSLVDLESETLKLQNHYKDSVGNNSTYRINFPEKEFLSFEPYTTLQLVIIINEGLHNASLYSQANFIFSIASIENGKLNIITHDNGVGYDRKMVTNGNGIEKILKATNRLDGELRLTSTLGNGTVVNAEIPVSSISSSRVMRDQISQSTPQSLQ